MLAEQVQKHGCNVIVNISDNEPIFMMLSMDPKQFKGVSAPLDGPLLAFPKDGNAGNNLQLNFFKSISTRHYICMGH